MRIAIVLPALVSVVLTAPPAAGQEYDPMVSASGWTRADADGSFTFYDPAGKRLVTWTREGGTLGQVDVSRLDGPPEFWVIDSYGNAWVVTGLSLVQVDKKGKIGSRVRLPAAVADLAWEPRGMVLAYRSAEPYVEKREFKNGSVLWSWGSRPSGTSAGASVRLVVAGASEVAVARGGAMKLDILDLHSGKQLRQLAFAFKGAMAADLELGSGERGAMAWSAGLGVVFAAGPGSQAAQAKMNGLLLARLDLNSQVLDYLPTGLTEDHVLVGIVENEAAFLKPKGGLTYVAVR